MADQFLEWLERPECLKNLLPCARRVIRRAENLGITLADSYMDGGDTNAYNVAVATDLWQFLRVHANTLTNKATTFLVLKDEAGFSLLIVREFIDSCIDQRRNDSPFHAYYRHMRTVLSDTDGINYKSIPRKCSYYAWSGTKELKILPDNDDFSIKYLNYEEWAASSITFSEIYKNKNMVQLSRHYWDEALRIILAEYLLSIRGLVTFIATKYPLVPPPVEYEPGVGSEDDIDTPHLASGEILIDPGNSLDDDAWTRQIPKLASSIIEVELDRVARDCVEQLTNTERAVLCGLDAGSTLAEIARLLGMKTPSNVNYHQKLAYEKLRTSWSLWGQPDSEHYSVAEEEQLIFFKMVIKFCKAPDPFRDSGKESRP